MKILILSLSLLAIVANAQTTKESIIAEAQPKVADFKKTLIGQLQEGLKKSPHEAIEVCKNKAPQIAKEKSTENMKIGRTSLKLRNENNAAPKWALSILEKYKATNGNAPAAPEVVEIEKGKWGYAEPLYAQQLCVTCHGTQIDPELKKTITKIYPKDQATGFNVGDFRGIVWVELKK
ncbi:MAG: hypothetical protein BroJett040_13050 [Oligoflexia bacterium]|nr:MAG: hypothetical protein BroJett040_13050 [Oligoflexia bacterium]